MSNFLKKHNSIFVTGGAGFIGSHLIDNLITEGCQITVLDNLSSQANWIIHHVEQGRIKFVHGDLMDRELVENTMDGSDVVWHLGGNTNIPAGFSNTHLDIRNAILATHNVLDSMRSTGVPWLVFSSTGAVYGNANVVPTPESYGPLFPLSLYGAGKLACEALISAYSSLFGLNARIFRFGNVVGSRMNHGVIYDFIKKLRKNPNELEILGNGKGLKSYFLVQDCIEEMKFILDGCLTPDSPHCDLINLSGENSTSVMDIARIIIEEMGLGDVEFKFTGGDQGWPGDQPRVRLSIEKLKSLGWTGGLSSNDAVRRATRSLVTQVMNAED